MANDPPEWAREFLRSVQAIEAHTQAVTTLIPEQTNELNKRVAEVYKGAGASTAQPGPASTSGRRSGSSSLDDGDTPALTGWRARATAPENDEQGLAPWLHLPGAHPTPVDYFQMMSVTTANLAKRREDKEREAEINQLATRYGSRDAIPDDVLAEAKSREYTSGDSLGKVSNVFASGKTGYIQGRVVSSMVKDMLQPFNDARKFGYETGYSGSSQPGPLGLRAPWDAPAMAGLGQKFSELGFSFNNDVTPAQAGTIYNNLFGQGWMGGQATDAMRTASAQMMRQNPYVASMPEYYSMMDQATRLGAASLQEFNGVMFGVADAAKAAHTTLPQTIADMQQLGQLNKQMGGTFQAGLANAQQWQTITGMPASTMGPLLQNGMVQGQTFLRTGLMPQAQGLATPGQHIESIMGAMNMVNSIVVPPGKITSPIGNTGFSDTVSSQDYKESIMASLFPGTSKAFIHAMLSNSKGILAGAQINRETDAYQRQVQSLVASGNAQGLSDIETKSGPGTWKQVRTDLTRAVDTQGHHMFENWDRYNKLRDQMKPIYNPKNHAIVGQEHQYTTQQAHASAVEYAARDIERAGDDQFLKDTGHWVAAKGMSKDQRNQLVNQIIQQGGVSGKALYNRAFNRDWKEKQYQAQFTKRYGASSGNDNTGPKLTIELGKGAKQLFKLVDPMAAAKNNAGAGQATIALSTNGAATTAPYPDPNTTP